MGKFEPGDIVRWNRGQSGIWSSRYTDVFYRVVRMDSFVYIEDMDGSLIGGFNEFRFIKDEFMTAVERANRG